MLHYICSALKFRNVILVVLLVLLADQGLKIYVKLNFFAQEHLSVIGNWFQLFFIENDGMAFGMKFGTKWGKLILTSFRLIAVIWGFYFVNKELVKKGYAKGLVFCAALILAGAMGNLIDSLFYGKIFTETGFHAAKLVPWGQGYGELFHGKVVDMLYFPLFSFTWPDFLPYVGGTSFEFFRPIFNIADSSIFIGVATILLFQKRLLGNRKHE